MIAIKPKRWLLLVQLSTMAILLTSTIYAAEIERFEYFSTNEGLSQSTVTSIHCDSRGFLWIGTMNGLNRFDGYNFKIYQNTVSDKEKLTNNRVVSIWEDRQNFLWFETYDGYYHYYNPRNEIFSTLPKYMVNLEEKYSKINCFHQYSPTEIWLGSSNSGVYYLAYDSIADTYESNQFLSRGQYALSNNDIRFVVSDKEGNVYIGSKFGLNTLKVEDIKKQNFYFQHYFSDVNFTSAITINNEVWLGTEKNGLVVYNIDSKTFFNLNKDNSPLKSNKIDLLKLSTQGNVLIGSSDLFIYQPSAKRWLNVSLDGNTIDKLFEDCKGVLWVTTGKLGVQQVNQQNGLKKHFDLTTDKYNYLSDKERPYFYEDREKNLWICVHGAGLAQYIRSTDSFIFHRNNPSDPKSISSNTVMCMTEDRSGNLWVGTGMQGGLNKVIFQNPAFKSIPFSEQYNDFMENVVRAVFEDSNENLWVSSKGGQIKIYNKYLEEITPRLRFPFTPSDGLVFNVYSIFQDRRGYIWLGSKGAGIAVSTQPVNASVKDYSKIKFVIYRNQPTDSTSLSNNNIYCIDEDSQGKIWFGTYGSGLSFTNPTDILNLSFVSLNSENSNLSANMVRDIAFDAKNNLWAATTFGLNKLSADSIKNRTFTFECFYSDPSNTKSLSYNDVVHIFEDSKQQMWFGTFGGGVNVMTSDSTFKHFTTKDGLNNNDVFGITEDAEGYIWLSTENGISRFGPTNKSFENYNKSNSLGANDFSENTCCKTKKGKLIFGSVNGFEVIDPSKIVMREFSSHVTFTNFQLFNKDIDLTTVGTPLKKSITYTNELKLTHNQSSFSLEYSAMNFLDKSKTQFAYFLENFDNEWNYVGTERKATYTNLKPGHYIFRVKAALWNGNWDTKETQLKITILPPFWATKIAYIFYLVVFLLSTFFISRGVIRNSSIRNQLKVEKAVNEVKLQFFTNISHEIRTPLTLILGPIEDVLADKKFPAEYKSTLQLMQKNGQRMLHLLNQLLDFRKVQNKKMLLKVAPVDIVEFTQNIYNNFIPLAQHKQIQFNLQTLAKPENVWVDPHRMDSVIFNILSNAFKFTPSGKNISVAIDQNLDRHEVYIKIIDSGKGIKSKDIPLIFNRYTILSDENSTNTGTGIGLNLSNEIVKLHGGEIKIESVHGKGSEFCIVLKTGTSHFANNPNVVLVDKNNGDYVDQNLTIDISSTFDIDEELNAKIKGEKQTILVVEDNLQILKYIADALSARFSVITAQNGKEGLDVALQFNPDLIISDVMMPVIDGIEMTRLLKENFDTCHIPIILLTAKSGIDDQILGIESGAEAYILKPFNMQMLKAMILNMLEQRKLILSKFKDKADIDVSSIKINARNKDFLNNIIKYVEENYTDPNLTINSLVEYSCVSRTVFYNKIKSLTGLSPIELMRQIKLKIAAQMLANGYNVNEASFNIGFNDSRYFSKQFKELYGESPSQYKKKHSGLDEHEINQDHT
jgi:signal transduction histidine kinase/ligand-binding sensor domain-containing protein/DNA-binding response OmpR family regulator